ncbi:MAG: single-stranded-DNA-specific exonuclease RecJ [Terriglobales bacterium]
MTASAAAPGPALVEAAAERFQLGLGLSATLARLLAARGWRELDAVVEFLYPRLEHTHSPWLMAGMAAAVERILAAVAAGEPIRILGDYDADGTLATVILRQALRTLGAACSYELPERLGDGYGLQAATVERAVAAGVRLAITVDNGIREQEALERARELGLDVIVTDHHLPPESLPPAVAILNPHQPGCSYPDKSLCGSGVAFKLAQALLERSGPAGEEQTAAWPPRLRSYLKLVALATIADAVPLLGENRVLTRFGLEGLTEPVNPGLRALLASALPPGHEGRITSSDVSFRIVPRINAAGRMGAADQVVELFAVPAAEAQQLAQALDQLNRERQVLCDRIEAEALAQIAADAGASGEPILMLAGEGWHRGVLGIVANRLLQRAGKPVLVLALENGVAHGSGRAPAGFHLLQVLERRPELFVRFGGHAQAVGCTLATERLPELRALLASAPREAPAAPDPVFEIRLAELTPAFARELARLEPYGEANPEPWFLVRGVELARPPERLKERHLKLAVAQGECRHTALFWNLWRDERYQTAPRRPSFEALQSGACLDLVFRLESGTHPQYGWRQQLILRDFFVTSAARANS